MRSDSAGVQDGCAGDILAAGSAAAIADIEPDAWGVLTPAGVGPACIGTHLRRWRGSQQNTGLEVSIRMADRSLLADENWPR
jgi:hypothetical protein